jgi:hypothetical protein
VAARSKAWTVFDRTNTAIVGFESHSRHECLCVYSVSVVLCVGCGLATGWSLSKETYRLCSERRLIWHSFYRRNLLRKRCATCQEKFHSRLIRLFSAWCRAAAFFWKSGQGPQELYSHRQTRWMDGWMDGRTDRKTDRQIGFICSQIVVSTVTLVPLMVHNRMQTIKIILYKRSRFCQLFQWMLWAHSNDIKWTARLLPWPLALPEHFNCDKRDEGHQKYKT